MKGMRSGAELERRRSAQAMVGFKAKVYRESRAPWRGPKAGLCFVRTQDCVVRTQDCIVRIQDHGVFLRTETAATFTPCSLPQTDKEIGFIRKERCSIFLWCIVPMARRVGNIKSIKVSQ